MDCPPVNLPPGVASQPPIRRRRGLWITLVAVAVAVAVVATLAGVLHARSNAPIPTVAAHVTHARGHWQEVIQYTNGCCQSTISVDPYDPRIAYRIDGTITPMSAPPYRLVTVMLARTSDGGATWTTLTLPTDDVSSIVALTFSPLDAQTVFLTLLSEQSDARCTAYPLGYGVGLGLADTQPVRNAGEPLDLQYPGTGSYPCYSFQYVSRDGGAHWSQPSFPWPAQHFADVGIGTRSFLGQAQGKMLFASVTGNDEHYDSVRLVASEDGGSTWNDVDGAIYTAGQVVTSYTAIHGTTSLYAISVPQDTPSGQEAPSVLWSSADAGANWKRVGPAPLALAEMTGTTLTPGGTTLYAVGIPPVEGAVYLGRSWVQPVGKSQVPVFASRDGGRKWVRVSSAGWPQYSIADPWSLTTLADGSLLMQFNWPPGVTSGGEDYSPGPSFYGWRPGDATWFPVAPRETAQTGWGDLDQTWLASPAKGPQSIWIVLQPPPGIGIGFGSPYYTVSQCVLQ